MSRESGDNRKRILRLTKNTLTLSFLLVFLSLLHPELTSLINYFLQGFAITSQTILNIINLIFIVYFGYLILIDAKYFLDTISAKLGAKERNKSKTIIYDIAGIISLVLAFQLVNPLLNSVTQFGGTFAKVVSIVFFAIGLFLVYHIATQIYHVGKQNIEKLIEDANHIKQERKKKTAKGEKE
jgi:hypothetical protein